MAAAKEKPIRGRAAGSSSFFSFIGESDPIELGATGYCAREPMPAYVCIKIDQGAGLDLRLYMSPEQAERAAAAILEAVRVAKGKPPASPAPAPEAPLELAAAGGGR